MGGVIEVLSPEGTGGTRKLALAGRLQSEAGATLALHDNSKPGAVDLLEGVASALVRGGAIVRTWSKPHAARPSPHLGAVIETCQAAVLALGD